MKSARWPGRLAADYNRAHMGLPREFRQMSSPSQYAMFTPRTVIQFEWRDSDLEVIRNLRNGLRWRPAVEGLTGVQEKDGWGVLRQLAGDDVGSGPQEVHLDHLPYIVEWAKGSRGWFENLIEQAQAERPGSHTDALIPEWRQAVEELTIVAHLVQEIIDWFGTSHSKATERISFGPDDFDPAIVRDDEPQEVSA